MENINSAGGYVLGPVTFYLLVFHYETCFDLDRPIKQFK